MLPTLANLYSLLMGERRNIKMRRLSKEFLRDVNKDAAKRCIIPAKCLLEVLLAWPGTDTKCIIIADWIILMNIFLAEIFHVAYAVVHRRDIVTTLLISATITTTMESLVRIYVIIRKKDVLNDVLCKIWKCFWPLASMTAETSDNLRTKCYVMIALTFGCFGPAIFCNSIISLWPYLMENDLILKSSLPFKWNQTYVYEAVYTWQYFLEWYILLIVNVFDNLVVSIMAICVVQFIILQNIFESILSDRSRFHRKILFGEEISNREIVRRCLAQQKMLFQVCEALVNILSTPMLVQFFNSTAAICASCIVLKVEPGEFSKMLTYAIAHMFQLFSYCFVGHELSIQSGNVAIAVYSCKWEDSDDVQLKKAVILMMQRSQRLQTFTVANITDLDLVSYVKVLRLSFSFYTLFNNLLYNEDVNEV